MSNIQESQKNTLLNYDQAAVLLNMHSASLRRLVSKGKIPHYKIGKSVRFSESQLLNELRVEVKNV